MKQWLYACLAVGVVACSGKPANQATSDDAGEATPPSANGPVATDDAGSADEADGGAALGASPGPATPGDAASPSPSPTPTPTGDSGATGAPAGTGVFADAGAYVPTLGPSSDNPQHSPTPNPAGQDCLSCHGATTTSGGHGGGGGNGGGGNGGGGATRFLFAGTVWSSPSGSAPTAQAEVRVVQADGSQLVAYTDQNGNFYFMASPGAALAPPASAGVRDATGAISMVNVFNDGDCNSCHRLGGEPPINLP
jgi:hypothetical protein